MEKHGLENKIEAMVLLLEKMKAILEEYTKNPKLAEMFLFAAEKKAEEIVELATTINQALLKSKGKISTSYHDSFTDLKIFKEFTEPELKILASTAGFRNRLAHEYLTVDETIAIKTMKNMLNIYPPYLKKIQKVISTRQKPI